MKFSDVLSLPEVSRQKDIWTLTSCLHHHMEEIPVDSAFELPADSPLTIKTHIFINFDGERTLELGSVWFEDKPFMVYFHAGRGATDDVQDWTFDYPLREKAAEYILELIGHKCPIPHPCGINDNIPKNLYGSSIEYWLKR